jgi:hypothetical protein
VREKKKEETFLFGLQGQLYEDLLEPFVHVVDAKLLESFMLYEERKERGGEGEEREREKEKGCEREKERTVCLKDLKS